MRAFAFYTAVAVITWTIFIVMTGYVGGQVLQENAFAAFVAGLVVALGVTALLQLGLRAFGGPSAAPADR
jgi:membrane protein DedA with SNARE-associated domain